MQWFVRGTFGRRWDHKPWFTRLTLGNAIFIFVKQKKKQSFFFELFFLCVLFVFFFSNLIVGVCVYLFLFFCNVFFDREAMMPMILDSLSYVSKFSFALLEDTGFFFFFVCVCVYCVYVFVCVTNTQDSVHCKNKTNSTKKK